MGSPRHRKKRKRSLERQETQLLARNAVKFLIEESLKLRLTNPQRSKELFHTARKIGKRGRFHLPHKYRFLFCWYCHYPLSIETAKIRLNSKKHQIHYLCLNCKNEKRYGYLYNRKKKMEE